MSQENVEIVRRSNAAFNRGDRDGTVADYHPDVEWRALQPAPDASESVRGTAAVLVIWDQWEAAFEQFSAEIEEYVDTGKFVVVVVQWRGEGGGSGLAVDNRTADLYEFEDEKIVRITVGYSDKDAALKAVGLTE